MKFNFPEKAGKGLRALLPNASDACVELLNGMLEYDPENRLTTGQCLRHPYFKEIRDREKAAARKAMADRTGRSKQGAAPAQSSSPSTSSRRDRRDPRNRNPADRRRRVPLPSTRRTHPSSIHVRDGREKKAPSHGYSSSSGYGQTTQLPAHLTKSQVRSKKVKSKSLPKQQPGGGNSMLPPILLGLSQMEIGGVAASSHAHGRKVRLLLVTLASLLAPPLGIVPWSPRLPAAPLARQGMMVLPSINGDKRK